jgi:hypothetical protein
VPASLSRLPRWSLHYGISTVDFFLCILLSFLELVVSVLVLFDQFFINFYNFFVFLIEAFLSRFRQCVDVILQIFSGLLDLMIEFMLKGQEGIVGTFGFIGDILLTAFYFSEYRIVHLSISWKRASSCFFHSSLLFFMYSKSSPICASCFLSRSERCLSCSAVDISFLKLKVRKYKLVWVHNIQFLKRMKRLVIKRPKQEHKVLEGEADKLVWMGVCRKRSWRI